LAATALRRLVLRLGEFPPGRYGHRETGRRRRPPRRRRDIFL